MRGFLIMLLASSAGLSSGFAQEPAQVSVMDWRGKVLLVHSERRPTAAPALRDRLREVITVTWQERPLSDIVRDVHRLTGINIVLDPRLAAKAPAVSFSAEKMRTGHVMQWLARLSDGHLSPVDHALWLGSEPYRARGRSLALYDITDLSTPIRHFPGPDMALSTTDATTGQGGVLLPAAGQPDHDIHNAAEEIAEIIRGLFTD